MTSPVTPLIDEAGAWKLLRSLARSQDDLCRVVKLDEDSGSVLEVDLQGNWSAAVTVTDAARSMLDLYFPLVTRARVVVGQLGQSVDGRIATESGASHYVTGPEDLDRLHRLRALVDAVIVGANTVASDDPRLTVRRAEGENPVRVVLDPGARLSRGYNVFTDGVARTIVVRAGGPSEGTTAPDGTTALDGTTAPDGFEEVFVPTTDSGSLDLVALLRALRARGLAKVLVEGGGVTVSRFLQADLLDRLHVAVAPMLIGSGRPSLTLDPIVSLDAAMRPPCRHFPLGRDVLFDFDLRSPSE